jgi:large subunit ribosomal protein L10e
MKRKVTVMYRDSQKRFWSKRKKKGLSYKGLQPFNLTFSNGNRKIMDVKQDSSSLLLIAKQQRTIFPESLESVRLTINRLLLSRVGKSNYYLEVLKYPHKVLREHRMAKGAKADRISDGMRRAFGKANRRAMLVKQNDTLIKIIYSKNNEKLMETLLPIISKTKSKLSAKSAWTVLKN